MNLRWNEVTWYSRLGAILLFLVVVPIISFVVGERYQEVQNLQAPTSAAVSGPKTAHSFSISYATSTLSRTSIGFTITVPTISIPSDTVTENAINTDIKKHVDAIVANYSSDENVLCPSTDDAACQASVTITSTSTSASRFDSVSIALNSFSTSERMAHPDYEREAAISYDLDSGKEESYLDLLGGDRATMLTKLQDLSRKKLKELMPGTFSDSDDEFSKGTEGTTDNYKYVLLDEEGLRVLFSYYQVGPRPVGAPEIFITYKELGI